MLFSYAHGQYTPDDKCHRHEEDNADERARIDVVKHAFSIPSWIVFYMRNDWSNDPARTCQPDDTIQNANLYILYLRNGRRSIQLDSFPQKSHAPAHLVSLFPVRPEFFSILLYHFPCVFTRGFTGSRIVLFYRKENVWSSPINDSGGGGSGLLSTPSENLRCVQSPLRLILFSAWISTGFRALTESCISLSSFCYSFFFALPNGIFLLP